MPPVVIQERLIGALSQLSGADRRAFARLMTNVARLVAPSTPGVHPPMLFEEAATTRASGSTTKLVGR